MEFAYLAVGVALGAAVGWLLAALSKKDLEKKLAAQEKQTEQEQLKLQMQEERAASEACRKQTDDLKDQVRTLELKGAFMSGGDSSSAAREKIDRLIREIDKCISLLEKD